LECSYQKDIVAVFGATGSGKSTLLNLLLGNKLKVIDAIKKRCGRLVGGKIDLENPNVPNSFKIGHTSVSCTSLP
jgi:GTPase Era involved in 16S rRNA processing